MKTTTRNLLIAGLAGASLLSASAVIAGGAGCGGRQLWSRHERPRPGNDGPWSRLGGPRHAAFAPEDRAGWQTRHAQVDVVKLQPTQEGAWNAFCCGRRPGAGKDQGQVRDEMWEKARTTPERMDLASKLSKEREQGMEKVTQAMKALYEMLTPEQRKVLDRRGPWVHG